ncbi:MAG: iron ABC transporter substrate-binding protein, partial [Pseudomonas indica]|nr:iron ABC transporter substrate-binding protein [Pseudomonas indica]
MSLKKSVFAVVALTALSGISQAADEIVVYSSRIDELIKPVFDQYTAKTGARASFSPPRKPPFGEPLRPGGPTPP